MSLHLRYTRGKQVHDDKYAENEDPVCTDPSQDACSPPPQPLGIPLPARDSWIDYGYTDEGITPKVCGYHLNRFVIVLLKYLLMPGPEWGKDGRG